MELAAIVVAVFAVVLVSISFRLAKEVPPKLPRSYLGKQFQAISVRPQLHSCQAVRELENIRFLAKDAPSIPVRGCDIARCRCQYLYYPDRREEERRSPFGLANNFIPSALGADRRSGDRRNAATG